MPSMNLAMKDPKGAMKMIGGIKIDQKQLKMKAQDHFKKKGCRSIQSFVFIKNKKVLNFYDKLKYTYDEEGFIIVKRLK